MSNSSPTPVATVPAFLRTRTYDAKLDNRFRVWVVDGGWVLVPFVTKVVFSDDTNRGEAIVTAGYLINGKPAHVIREDGSYDLATATFNAYTLVKPRTDADPDPQPD